MLGRLRTLGRNLAIYGLGDVATNIVSFFLLPLYVRYLSLTDYGAIGLLISVEVVAKIVFRWGIDASFMRLFYDCETDADRQRLASTLFWFLFAVNGALLAVLLVVAPLVASRLFGLAGYELPLRLVLINTFVIGFYFFPFHVLRIGEQSTQFVKLTAARSAATLVTKLLLIVGLGLGVLGFVLADIVVTAVFTLVLWRWFAPLLRPVFSRAILIDALRFGLPRVPHGIGQQVVAVSDRYLLGLFAGLREVGLYSVGATFGLAMKLFLSAFEYAWAPFYFATMKEPDAKATFRLVATYGLAVLVLLEAGLAAIAPDLVRLMTRPEFYDAARVVPWIGLGVVFQGVYLLTSIGLNITKQTRYYPVATGAAAATSVLGNLVLLPRFGAVGAAWVNAAAYAVQAGTAFVLSQRVYPVRLETGRIIRLAVAGLGAWLAARAVPDGLPALAAVLVRGTIVCAVYPMLAYALGFFDARELRTVARLVTSMRRRRLPPSTMDIESRTPAVDAGVDAPVAPEEVGAPTLAEDVRKP